MVFITFKFIFVRGKRTRDNISDYILFIEHLNTVKKCIRFLLMRQFLTCTYDCVDFNFYRPAAIRTPKQQISSRAAVDSRR